MKTTEFGREGESLARQYLEGKGYFFLERNFKRVHGEIDLIMQDGETLVFVEVKSRHSRRYGEPIEAVTPYKQRHIRDCAKIYLMNHPANGKRIRFDVVEVMAVCGEVKFKHTQNAF